MTDGPDVPVYEQLAGEQLSLLTPEEAGGPPADLQADVITELHALSYLAYEQLVRVLLQRMGYREVRPMGRRHARGRRHNGGLDLHVAARTGVTETPVAVAVKQYRRPVPRRAVDELRGVIRRVGAIRGILITTSTFARTAREPKAQPADCRVELIDGAALCRLLAHHKLVAKRRGNGLWRIDRRFLSRLRALYPAKSSRPSARHPLLGKARTDRLWSRIRTRVQGEAHGAEGA